MCRFSQNSSVYSCGSSIPSGLVWTWIICFLIMQNIISGSSIYCFCIKNSEWVWKIPFCNSSLCCHLTWWSVTHLCSEESCYLNLWLHWKGRDNPSFLLSSSKALPFGQLVGCLLIKIKCAQKYYQTLQRNSINNKMLYFFI